MNEDYYDSYREADDARGILGTPTGPLLTNIGDGGKSPKKDQKRLKDLGLHESVGENDLK